MRNVGPVGGRLTVAILECQINCLLELGDTNSQQKIQDLEWVYQTAIEETKERLNEKRSATLGLLLAKALGHRAKVYDRETNTKEINLLVDVATSKDSEKHEALRLQVASLLLEKANKISQNDSKILELASVVQKLKPKSVSEKLLADKLTKIRKLIANAKSSKSMLANSTDDDELRVPSANRNLTDSVGR